MHISFDCVLRNLCRRLKKRTDVDVEAEIGKCCRYDLGAAIMAVLSHLGDENARPPPLLARKGFNFAADRSEFVVALVRAAVNAGHRTDLGAKAAEYTFHCVRYLADGRARAG